MEAYLDHASTTQAFPEVIEETIRILKEDYGNPSSLHHKGMKAERSIIKTKEILSKLLKINKNEIYFTSGGTESNNLAILGCAKAYERQGKHIITTSIEHASVLSPLKALEEMGHSVTYLNVNSNGLIDLQDLKNAITEDTILVSIMHVNNEIGSKEPIGEIGSIIKQKNPKTKFHVDAIQSFGKANIFPKRMKIDLLSISGHKIHASKGVGALYISNQVRVKPLLYGGSHQSGIRSGTENVSGIAALGIASKKMYESLDKHRDYLYNLKRYFISQVTKHIEGVFINGSDAIEETAPHIVNIRFNDIRGEVLLHALESSGIYVSTGSACSSNKSSQSHVLKAIGLNEDAIEGSIRFSFSILTTKEELDYCIQVLIKTIPKLRLIKKK